MREKKGGASFFSCRKKRACSSLSPSRKKGEKKSTKSAEKWLAFAITGREGISPRKKGGIFVSIWNWAHLYPILVEEKKEEKNERERLGGGGR